MDVNKRHKMVSVLVLEIHLSLFSGIVWSKLKSQKALERWQPDTEVSYSETDIMLSEVTFSCTALTD